MTEAECIKKMEPVAKALITIRDQRLFRDKYATFEDYVRIIGGGMSEEFGGLGKSDQCTKLVQMDAGRSPLRPSSPAKRMHSHGTQTHIGSHLVLVRKAAQPKGTTRTAGRCPEHGDQAKPFKNTRESAIVAALEELRKIHEAAQRSYCLVCVASAWQFVSQPEFAPWIIAMLGAKARPPRLSLPALETLAVIAYRQPVTRGAIEQIRASRSMASCRHSWNAG